MDQLIRDVLIDFKQAGGTKVSNMAAKIASNLLDAASATELLNAELLQISPALNAISNSSRKAADNINNMSASSSVNKITKSLANMEASLERVVGELVDFQEIAVKGFNTMIKSSQKMTNTVTRAMEQTTDATKELGSTLGRTGKEYDSIDRKSRRAAEGIAASTRPARGQGRDFAAISDLGGSLPMLYAKIASNVFVLNTAFELLEEGDQLNRLERINTALSSISGISVNSMARSLEEASGSSISFEAAVQTATKATMEGFSSKQLSDFAVVAKRSASVLGVSFDDALNRVMNGVTRLDATQVKALGLTTRLDDAYKMYAKTLNVNSKSLNNYQKTQAYINAIISESTDKFGKLDSAIASTPWEEFGSQAEGSLQRLKKSVSEVSGPTLDLINSLLYIGKSEQAVGGAIDFSGMVSTTDLDNLESTINLMKTYKDEMAGISKIEREATSALEDTRKKIEDLTPAVAKYLEYTKALRTFSEPGKTPEIMFTGAEEVTRLTAAYKKYEELVNTERRLLKDLNATNLETSKSSYISSMESLFSKSGDVSAGIERTTKSMAALKIEISNVNNFVSQTESKLTNSFGNASLVSAYTEQLKRHKDTLTQLNIQYDLLSTVQGVLTTKFGEFAGIGGAGLNHIKDNLDSVTAAQGELVNFAKAGASALNEEMLNVDNIKSYKNTLSSLNTLLVSSGELSKIPNVEWKQIADMMGMADISLRSLVGLQQEFARASGAAKAYSDQVTKDLQLELQLRKEGKSDEVVSKTVAAERLEIVKAHKNAQISLSNNMTAGSQEAISSSKTIQALTQEELKLEIDLLKTRKERGKEQKVFVDMSEKIALINSRDIDSYSYGLQMLKLQLKEEEAKYNILDKRAKKEAEAQNALVQIAQLRRQIDAKEGAEQDARLLSYQRTADSIQAINEKWGNVRTKVRELVRLEEELASIQRDGTKDLQEEYDLTLKILQAKRDIQKAQSDEKYNEINAGNSSIGAVFKDADVSQMSDDEKLKLQRENSRAFFDESMSQLSAIDAQSVAVGKSVGSMVASFHAMANGSMTVAQGVAQGMQTLATVMNYASNQKVSAYDDEIKAEKERDGKSEESVRKIKRLEAKKLAEQKKNALTQIAIQTAVAIMMAAANLWPFPAIPMMAAAAIAGGLAYSAASSGSISSGGGADTSAGYLSLGSRQNNIDVSMQANAGEMSYIQGAQGVGSAQNFVPRAEGGDMIPGVGYLLGEHGTEKIVPKVPMKAISNDAMGSSTGATQTPIVLQVSAMDASSFADYVAHNSDAILGSLTKALSERGRRL